MVTPLHQIVREGGGALDFKAALQVLVHGVSRALRAEACSVYLKDEKGFLALMATVVLGPDSIGRIRLSVGKGLAGLVAEREEPVNLGDVNTHIDGKYAHAAHEELFLDFLGVPIIHQRRLVGALVVQRRPARCFRDSHLAFLVTLAAHLAGIITFVKASTDQNLLA